MVDEFPRISIVVPTYNRGHLLPRLFESLLRQSDTRFELVIVDDGSTDRTPQVVEEFRQRLQRPLISVRHPDNRGCNAARNTGVCAANTPWCLFADSDWEFFPDSVQRAIQHIDVPDAVGAVGFLSLRLPRNAVHGYRPCVQRGKPVVIPYEDVVLKRNTMGPGSMFWMIRRSVFYDHAIWFPEWVHGLENLFGARVARRKQMLAVPHVLGIVHFDPAEDHISLRAHRRWPTEFRRGYELFVEENYDVLRLHVKEYRHLVLSLTHCSLYGRSYWQALVWGLRAVYWKVYLILQPLLPRRPFARRGLPRCDPWGEVGPGDSVGSSTSPAAPGPI